LNLEIKGMNPIPQPLLADIARPTRLLQGIGMFRIIKSRIAVGFGREEFVL
jgi:hypothetical protein